MMLIPTVITIISAGLWTETRDATEAAGSRPDEVSVCPLRQEFSQYEEQELPLRSSVSLTLI